MFLFPAFLTAQLSKTEPPKVDKKELATMRKAIEKYPDSLQLHEAYIKAVTVDNPALLKQYDQWVKKFPKSATVPLAIGSALYRKEYPSAKPYLLKAVERDPKLAQVWQMLSFDASRWGDEPAAREYMRKATETAPDDPGYAFYHAMNFEDTDLKRWREEIYKLAKRFPDTAPLTAVRRIPVPFDRCPLFDGRGYPLHTTRIYHFAFSFVDGRFNP